MVSETQERVAAAMTQGEIDDEIEALTNEQGYRRASFPLSEPGEYDLEIEARIEELRSMVAPEG